MGRFGRLDQRGLDQDGHAGRGRRAGWGAGCRWRGRLEFGGGRRQDRGIDGRPWLGRRSWGRRSLAGFGRCGLQRGLLPCRTQWHAAFLATGGSARTARLLFRGRPGLRRELLSRDGAGVLLGQRGRLEDGHDRLLPANWAAAFLAGAVVGHNQLVSQWAKKANGHNADADNQGSARGRILYSKSWILVRRVAAPRAQAGISLDPSISGGGW